MQSVEKVARINKLDDLMSPTTITKNDLQIILNRLVNMSENVSAATSNNSRTDDNLKTATGKRDIITIGLPANSNNGYSDTSSTVTIFAVAKGVTVSGKPCTRLDI